MLGGGVFVGGGGGGIANVCNSRGLARAREEKCRGVRGCEEAREDSRGVWVGFLEEGWDVVGEGWKESVRGGGRWEGASLGLSIPVGSWVGVGVAIR